MHGERGKGPPTLPGSLEKTPKETGAGFSGVNVDFRSPVFLPDVDRRFVPSRTPQCEMQ
jgi:hypothetical protein